MLPDSWTTAIAILAAAVFVTPPVPEQMTEAPVKNDGSARAKVEDVPRSNIPKSRCKSKKCAVIPWGPFVWTVDLFFFAARKGKLDPGAKQKAMFWQSANQNGCRCIYMENESIMKSIMKFPLLLHILEGYKALGWFKFKSWHPHRFQQRSNVHHSIHLRLCHLETSRMIPATLLSIALTFDCQVLLLIGWFWCTINSDWIKT